MKETLVDVDLYCGGERVEQLTFAEGDDFEAEVYCDNWRVEVVGFR